MSVPVMIAHLLLENWTAEDPGRVPEPDLVMEDSAQVDAYVRAGREDGFFAHIYFYHTVQVSTLVRSGDLVLDLACGPANQLAMMARMYPQTRFVGVDASVKMLDQAQETLRRCGVSNVELCEGDICHLDSFADGSLDVVMSTMSLHHLPDESALQRTCSEMQRVLKSGGGLYVVDFGRLKRQSTRDFFALDRFSQQPPLFAQDFRNSLAAAFSLAELTRAFSVFGDGFLQVRTSLFAPFMVVVRTPSRLQPEILVQQRLKAYFLQLSAAQRQDFRDFIRLFTYAGYPIACPVE